MNRNELVAEIRRKKSFLCVGLDSDIDKLPKHMAKEPEALLQFNKAIIDATLPYTVSYKINTAFYESLGAVGWDVMAKTIAYIPNDVFKIADAKRGDIGNTTDMYAKAFYKTLDFDAVTVAPYMGADSILPFLAYPEKFAIVLALTSNPSSADFETERLAINGEELYKTVIRKTAALGNPSNTMFVVGATKAEELEAIRQLVPDHFLLIPGVGAQGGNLADVARFGLNKDCGLLVNSSRAILYASSEPDFAEAAAKEAQKVQAEMAVFLS